MWLYRRGKPKPPSATRIQSKARSTFRGTRSALVRTLSTARCMRRRRIRHGGIASYAQSRAEITKALTMRTTSIFFYQIGQFWMSQVAHWAELRDKYRFWQYQVEHTGFNSWLGPHVFLLKWVWSC